MEAQEDPKSGDDLLTVGNIDKSVVAIGRGAQAIYQHIERNLTDVELLQQRDKTARDYLAEAVIAHIKQLERLAEQARQIPAHKNPYKALLSYDIADAPLFYGRSEAIKAVLSRLDDGALTILHADSGTGKTSLLKAGIVPRLLAAGSVPFYVRPKDDPVHEAVKDALLSSSVEGMRLWKDASLQSIFRQATEILDKRRIVVILDQFEEVFAAKDAGALKEFVGQLSDCLDDERVNVRWIISLRADAFREISSFNPPIKNPYANEYQLNAFTHSQAQEIIEEPVRRLGVTYEETLLKRILTDLDPQLIEPPQLQLVCSTLWDARADGKQITGELYDRFGGASGILQSHLTRVLDEQVRSDDRAAALKLLVALVKSDESRALRTEAQLRAELERQGVPAETTSRLLDVLTDSHLLHVEEIKVVESPQQVYELVHDYLLREVELDAGTKARKTALELLEQEVRNARIYGTTLDWRKLKLISPYLDQLPTIDGASVLIERAQEDEIIFKRQRVGAITLLALLVAIAVIYFGYPLILAQQARSMVKLIPISGYTTAWEQYEVTNARYALCVQANRCDASPISGQIEGIENLPVTGINAAQADAFCRWIGRTLPTREQWDQAATDVGERQWPWGSQDPDSSRANLLYDDEMAEIEDFGVLLPEAVGGRDKGQSPDGVADLIGNVVEWTRTRPADDAAAGSADWDSAAGEPMPPRLLVMGGSFMVSPSGLRFAEASEVNISSTDYGFRCVQQTP